MQKVVETIKIEKLEGGAFNVVQGDKYSDMLSYEEMLGLVSALTIAKEPYCLCWMQTKEQHEADYKKFSPKMPELQPWQKLIEAPKYIVPNNINIYKWNGDYNGDNLFISFNEIQLLGYRSTNYIVDCYEGKYYTRVNCKLIPCYREGLKAGDTAFASFSTDTFPYIYNYCKILDHEKIVLIDRGNIRIKKWNEPSLKWYKVVPL